MACAYTHGADFSHPFHETGLEAILHLIPCVQLIKQAALAAQ